MTPRSVLAKIAAIGAVRRKGVAGLKAYGGKIEGEGEVIHRSGPLKGQTTKFNIEGQPGSRPRNQR